MTIDPELLELMPVTVSIYPMTGQDDFGNNVYGPSVRYRARIEALSSTMLVATSDGGTTLARPGTATTVYIDFIAPPIAEGSKITFDEGGSTITARVVAQNVHYDEDGPYYQELTCQNNQET